MRRVLYAIQRDDRDYWSIDYRGRGMEIFADVAELLRFWPHWRDAEAMRLAAWLEDDPTYEG